MTLSEHQMKVKALTQHAQRHLFSKGILHMIPGMEGLPELIHGQEESQLPGKLRQKWSSGPILHESPGICLHVEDRSQQSHSCYALHEVLLSETAHTEASIF